MAPGVEPRRLSQRRVLTEPVFALVDALSVKHGRCYATEGSKREMLERKLGTKPGARSIYRVEKRLVRAGRLIRRRLMPGGMRPDGSRTSCGCVIVQTVSRQQARAAARAARKARYAKAGAKRPRRVSHDVAPEAGAVSFGEYMETHEVPEDARELLGHLHRPRRRRPPD